MNALSDGRPEGGSSAWVSERHDRHPAAASRCAGRIEVRGRQEPRHQGDGRGAARRDAEPAARRSRHQRRQRRHAACSSCTASRSPSGDEPGELLLDPTNVETAHFARHRRARRLQPHPDPVLRAAAAPPRRGVHPRPRRLPHRRPADRLPPGCAARVRRGRRQDATRASASPRPNGLHGANIELPYPSVGATEQVLLTAVRAEGVTELQNAAIEPEIMDLIAILQKMGAIISVEPNRVILIEGVDTLSGYTTARSSTATRPPAGPPPRSPPTATSSSAAPSSRR